MNGGCGRMFAAGPGWFASVRWWHEIRDRDEDGRERRTVHPVVAWQVEEEPLTAEGVRQGGEGGEGVHEGRAEGGVTPVLKIDLETLVNVNVARDGGDWVTVDELHAAQSTVMRVWYEPGDDEAPFYLQPAGRSEPRLWKAPSIFEVLL